jgi:hypothetical protein
MTDVNPYEGPESDNLSEGLAKKIGTFVATAGVLILGYGALASFVIPTLPPNAAHTGRMNSIYLMAIGAALSLSGLALRDLRLGRKKQRSSSSYTREISTGFGLLVIVSVVIFTAIVIAQM